MPVTDTLHINFENVYPFASSGFIPFSEVIMLRGRILNKKDYSVDFRRGYFSLSDSLQYSVFDTLIVKYLSVNLGLPKVFRRRIAEYRVNSEFHDTLRVMRSSSSAYNADYFFGKDIQKSGSIARGFSLGTTKDFTLTSGLRLQLSGKLTDDIQISAALTDENTPIQPEGNTEKLEEIDKVFIEIRHKNAVGTFGDYDYVQKIGEFGNINRKLQGLKGEFSFDDYKGAVAYASLKGKFNSNKFTGTEGVQGPYQLTGEDNEENIVVIAGSEKVYLDGEEMKRGEGNDYTIEYSNAQIKFTPKRLITSASRIYVDFEYTDQRYNRNFFASNFETRQMNGKLNFSVGYMREGDDESSPIDLSYTEEDKKILAGAGDNRLLAYRSGVSAGETDSAGVMKGVYSKIDTVLNNEPYELYVYAPGEGKFYVTFSYVGTGNGDYTKQSLGIYVFAGKGVGDYQPVQLLPLPELRQTGNILITAYPLEELSVSAEISGSIYDRNTLSDLDDNDNSGFARTFKIDLKPVNVRLFNAGLGRMGLSYKDRYIDKRYTSAERLNEVEFNRNYNISDESSAGNEVLRELTLNIKPFEELGLISSYGYLKQGNSFNSNRFNNTVSYFSKNLSVDYNYNHVKTENVSYKSRWIKQTAKVNYQFSFIKPSMTVSTEDKKNNGVSDDSLYNGSFKYFEILPAFNIENFHGLELSGQYLYRAESYADKGAMEKESDSYTQIYSALYKGIKNLNTSLNFTLRDKKYTEYYKEKGALDNQTLLIRSQSKFNAAERFITGDLYYETSTEKSARLERVFVKVAQGTGNYKYLGDLNNNLIADEDEFESVVYDGDFIVTTLPTKKLYPVIELKTGAELELSFEKIIKDRGLFGTFLYPLNSLTSLKIEEKSTEEKTSKIYLMDFSSFLNDSTTLSGSNNFLQEFHVFKNNSDLSFRLRYNQKKGLNNYSSGIEWTYYRERSLRIKFKLVDEIGNQTDITTTNDNLLSSKSSSNRIRKLTENSIVSDFSYRPQKNIEVGFKISTSQNTDSYPEKPTVISENSETLRLNFSFSSKGRLKIEIERDELTANNTDNYIPFEMTKGNVIGKNYYLRVNFDYNISGNLQMMLNYDGRMLGAAKPVHNAKAEARAYF